MLKYRIKNKNTNYEHLKEQNIDIDFSKKHLYVIQAKNSTCKTLFYNLTQKTFDNKKYSDVIIKNDNSFFIENNYCLDFKPIFYSYLDYLKNNSYKDGVKLQYLLNEEKISEKLLFEEFAKMRNEKIVIKFKDEFLLSFGIKLNKFENVIETCGFTKSQLEYFLSIGQDINDFLVNDIDKNIINNICSAGFYNCFDIYEQEIFYFEEIMKNIIEKFKNDRVVLDDNIKSAKKDRVTLNTSNKNGIILNSYDSEKLDRANEVISNYIPSLEKLFISILNSHNMNNNIKNFISVTISNFNHIFLNDPDDTQFNLTFLSNFLIFFYFIKTICDNDLTKTTDFFLSFDFNNCSYFIVESKKILKKYKKIIAKSKIKLIEDEFSSFFDNQINIKRKLILDYLFFEQTISPLTFLYKGEEITDTNYLSDGEINIILLLSVYIQTIFSEDHQKIIFFDDSTISLDKENQISLANFLTFLMEKHSAKIVLFTHDSLFAFLFKNIVFHKFKKDHKNTMEFIKIEMINSFYLIYEFLPPNLKNILDQSFSKENFIYKLSIYRESEFIFKKELESVYKSNNIGVYKDLNCIFDYDFDFLKCENLYFKDNLNKFPEKLKDGSFKTLLSFLIDKYILSNSINYNWFLSDSEKSNIFFHKYNLVILVKLLLKNKDSLPEYNKFWNNFSHDFNLDFSIFYDYDLRNIERCIKGNIHIVKKIINARGI